MGTPNKYNDSYCEKAVEILAKGKSLAAVCAVFKIGRSTLYEWRDHHPAFKKALEEGLQLSQDYWESLGHDGINGHIKNFGAAPWIFTMKNRFRADYAEDKDEKKTSSEELFAKIVDKLIDK